MSKKKLHFSYMEASLSSKLTFSSCCNPRLSYTNSHVHSHLNYYIYTIKSSNYVQNTLWQSGSDSKWLLSKVKIEEEKSLMGLETPPFMENSIKNFHFVFRMTYLISKHTQFIVGGETSKPGVYPWAALVISYLKLSFV